MHATQKQSKTNQWWRFIISLHWLVWTSLDLIESSPVLLHGLTQRDSTILCLYWKCTRLQPPLNLAWASAGASLTPSPTMATNRWTSVGTSPSNRGSRLRKQQIFRSRLQRPRRETLGAGILCNSLTFADLPEGNTWGSRLLPFRFLGSQWLVVKQPDVFETPKFGVVPWTSFECTSFLSWITFGLHVPAINLYRPWALLKKGHS